MFAPLHFVRQQLCVLLQSFKVLSTFCNQQQEQLYTTIQKSYPTLLNLTFARPPPPVTALPWRSPLAEQWRSSKQHIDAYTIATNAPATTDNPFPGFTKQMILCLKSKAAQGVAEVFNLLEHVGVAARLSKALKAMLNKQDVAYKAYRSWHDQQGKCGGRRGSYPSIRNFIIRTAVNAVFGH